LPVQPGQLFGVAGWRADRFSVSLVLASGLFGWSAAPVATGPVTGFIVQATGRFYPAFLTAAAAALAGAELGRFTVRQLREVKWEGI
jgi:hypothetical protein